MAPPIQVCLVSDIFLVIFSLSFLSTSAVLPKANIPLPKVKIPIPVASSKLVGNICNYESIGNRRFCLEALSTPEAVVANDSTQLGILIMIFGVGNGKATLNIYNEMIKKPNSPQLLKALNCSFSEFVENPQTTNYDVTVIDPEITNCEKELLDANTQAPRLLVGNRFMHYYIAMGCQITSILQLEKPNEY
ncbi:hypothetical protein ES332_D04G160900v1 [Gossypium tomentosum]|uniref:Pectinesterase inhibitor domain-containing protein n=1 Tax=Gossypium tomentosum TaxID=34277 RepID=A0A5D2LDS1_GOSTO|nr:hypothetical protein ES332_D04G160900v1 [Gossypium tomentosum]